MSREYHIPGGIGTGLPMGQQYDINQERASRAILPAGLTFGTEGDCLISGTARRLEPDAGTMYLYPMRVLPHPIMLKRVRIRPFSAVDCRVAIYRRSGPTELTYVDNSEYHFTDTQRDVLEGILPSEVYLDEGVEYFVAFMHQQTNMVVSGLSAFYNPSAEVPIVEQTATGYLVGGGSVGDTFTATFPSAVKDGSMMIACASHYNLDPLISAVSSSGVTWSTPAGVGGGSDPLSTTGGAAPVVVSYAENVSNAGQVVTFTIGSNSSNYYGMIAEVSGLRTDSSAYLGQCRYGIISPSKTVVHFVQTDGLDSSTLSTPTDEKGIVIAFLGAQHNGILGGLSVATVADIDKGLSSHLAGYTYDKGFIFPGGSNNRGLFMWHRTFNETLEDEHCTFYTPTDEVGMIASGILMAFASPGAAVTAEANIAILSASASPGSRYPGRLDTSNYTNNYVDDDLGIVSITYLSQEGADLL